MFYCRELQRDPGFEVRASSFKVRIVHSSGSGDSVRLELGFAPKLYFKGLGEGEIEKNESSGSDSNLSTSWTEHLT